MLEAALVLLVLIIAFKLAPRLMTWLLVSGSILTLVVILVAWL